MTRACMVAVVAAVLGLASTAAAQDEVDPRESAPSFYRRGAAAYGEGRFAEAASFFSRAYAMSPEPSLLYNLGLAYEGAHDTDRAIDAYERFLAAAPNASEAPEVERILAGLRRERDLSAQLARQREAAARGAENGTDQAPHHQEPPRRRSRDATTLVVGTAVGGVGVATLVAAIVLGAVAQSTYGEATTEPTQRRTYELEGTANDLALAANVSYVVGGLLALAGAVTAVIGVVTLDASHEVQASLGPTGVSLRGTF